MKSASPLSLLLFIQLTSAAPIALSFGKVMSEGCIDGSCERLLVKGFRSHIMVSRPCQNEPCAHSISSSSALDVITSEDIWFDNSPITPPSTMSPEEALALEVPLAASYLKALAQEADSNSQIAPSVSEPSLTVTMHSKSSTPSIAGLTTSLEDDIKTYIRLLFSSTRHTSSKLLPPPSSAPASSMLMEKPTLSNSVELGDENSHSLGLSSSDVFLSCTYVFPKDTQPPGTIATERKGDSLAWENGDADLLVVFLVLVFMIILVGIEAADRMAEK
ncbi:hypothetical protein B7463_g9291, partial [Scytalidium lignicola]